MKTNLKRNWTEADVETVRDILRQMRELTVGVHPGILAHEQYMAALAAWMWFGSEMSGQIDFGREKHSISEGYRARVPE